MTEAPTAPPYKPARPEIDAGEIWYVKLPGENSLTQGHVGDVTLRTVELRFERFHVTTGWQSSCRRYKITDVEFVEQVK